MTLLRLNTVNGFVQPPHPARDSLGGEVLLVRGDAGVADQHGVTVSVEAPSPGSFTGGSCGNPTNEKRRVIRFSVLAASGLAEGSPNGSEVRQRCHAVLRGAMCAASNPSQNHSRGGVSPGDASTLSSVSILLLPTSLWPSPVTGLGYPNGEDHITNRTTRAALGVLCAIPLTLLGGLTANAAEAEPRLPNCWIEIDTGESLCVDAVTHDLR